MTRKRGRSAKRTVRRSNAAGLTALALCFTKQLQLQAAPAPAVAVAGNASASALTNLVFSPVSVYAALALLRAGARGGTLQELLDTLGRDDLAGFARSTAERALADRSPSGGPAIAFACGAWLDAAAWGLLPAFRDAAAASFNAEARAVDFGNEPEKAVGEINGSLAAATNNRIDSILDPSSVNKLTPLVLTSVIYFKGRWEAPFAKAQTVVDKFHRLDGSTADVPFMCSARSQFIAIRDGYKVLKLPYRSPALAPPTPAPRKRKGRSTPLETKPSGDGEVAPAQPAPAPRKRKGRSTPLESKPIGDGEVAPAQPAPAPRKRKGRSTPLESKPIGDGEVAPAQPAPAPRKSKGRSTPLESKPIGDDEGDDNDRIPKYSLCVFLPDERDGLPGLVKKMASGSGFWKYRLPTSQVPVGNFRLPKFKVSVSGSVREVLRDGMGIESAFAAGEADLAGMATTKRDEDDAADANEAHMANMATTKRDKDDAADAGEADEVDAADAGEADLADMETTKRDEDDAVDAGEADLADMDDAADAGETDLADMATTIKRDEDDASDASEADLADMETTKREDDPVDAGTPPLYVADVWHKAVLEVNEGGPVTVGGTANYMRCGANAVMDELVTVDFVADHPFLFFVIEEVSRDIVFVGRVLDPSV